MATCGNFLIHGRVGRRRSLCTVYLLFLVILGLPGMTMEFAVVVPASRKSPVRAYQVLEKKPGPEVAYPWLLHLIGYYLLMMFYTTVAGWMLHYFCSELPPESSPG